MDLNKEKMEPFGTEFDLVPEEGELRQLLQDKQIFGVYEDEDGADRAIRQLNKLGYAPSDIYLYTMDEDKARRVTEETQKDINVLSCGDGSDFIGESYHKGDIVLCVLKDAQRFQGKAVRVEAPKDADTAVEIAENVAEEKKEE